MSIKIGTRINKSLSLVRNKKAGNLNDLKANIK